MQFHFYMVYVTMKGMNDKDASQQLRYRVGIDVGTHSIGFCAVEVDESGMPIQLLNSMVHKHDSGIDPGGNDTATTRLAEAGVARRTRRLIRRRKKRLQELDAFIEECGWPLVDLATITDARSPWRIRAHLATEHIDDEAEQGKLLSIALRHMARHRGWRSPYARISSLHIQADPSEQLKALAQRVSEKTGISLTADQTPAQLISVYLDVFETGKLRGPEGILGGKLMQSDNANELRRIATVQGLDNDLLKKIIGFVFAAESPKGSAAKRVGKDVLPGAHGLRAEKAHPAFQQFRIVSIVQNLRIKEGTGLRALTSEETEIVVDFLNQAGLTEAPTWEEVADNLEIPRSHLKGTATEGFDGIAPSTRPPFDVTSQKILNGKLKKLSAWWKDADYDHRCAMVNALSNVGSDDEGSLADDDVREFLSDFTDEELEALDKVELPGGRAAYSVDSLEKLTNTMLSEGCDLHSARKIAFGVDDSWTPPAEPIGQPVGNPAVDRVLKQVARWISAATNQWGTPESVNIEHVRDALGSEKASREYQRSLQTRRIRNEKLFAEMRERLDIGGKPRRSELTRYLALQRQNCQCLYCGMPITYTDAEMDHIVPRKGAASTNTRENFAAVCRACNHQKSNLPFAVWAEKTERPGVSVKEAYKRVSDMRIEPGMNGRQMNEFRKAIRLRLTTKHADAEIDGRSLESVAWMANELRHRIEGFYRSAENDVTVRVFRGAVTAEGRRASGFESRVNLIGGKGKTRLDRRHHAMDALTIALMEPGIAQTIALRMNMRESQRVLGEQETWKSFTGGSDTARKRWEHWCEEMLRASELFNVFLAEDRIPICQNKRLRLGSSAVHKAIVQPFEASDKRIVSDAMPVELIDRASTPALWTALTRDPDFDPKEGLPANPSRTIRLHDKRLGPNETVEFFPTAAACLAIRGGYCEIGAGIHHARIFHISGKKTTYAMLRVYQCDLVRFQKENLLTVELPANTISVRTAVPKLREALAHGTAEQIGWLVVGDELKIDLSGFTTGQIETFNETYPQATRWEVTGFPTKTQLRLKPLLIASEGLADDVPDDIVKIVKGPGWWPAIDKLLKIGNVVLYRRDTHGKPRVVSHRSLPLSSKLQ